MSDDATISFTASPSPQHIIFACGNKEMLVIKPDGFYIDGEKVEDNKHKIYERFLQFTAGIIGPTGPMNTTIMGPTGPSQ